MKRATFLSTLITTGTLGVASPAPPSVQAARGTEDWLGSKVYLGAGASLAKIDDAKVRDNDVSTAVLQFQF